jgi:hypothetical protein
MAGTTRRTQGRYHESGSACCTHLLDRSICKWLGSFPPTVSQFWRNRIPNRRKGNMASPYRSDRRRLAGVSSADRVQMCSTIVTSTQEAIKNNYPLLICIDYRLSTNIRSIRSSYTFFKHHSSHSIAVIDSTLNPIILCIPILNPGVVFWIRTIQRRENHPVCSFVDIQ